MEMQEKLIAKIIDLEEQANVHTAEYERLLTVPKSRTKAAEHHRKAVRLQSRIQSLIREIARWEEVPFLPVLTEDVHADLIYHP